MKRFLFSTISVAGSASSAAVNSDVDLTELQDAVAVGKFATPYALYIDKGNDTGDEVTIESLVLANQKNAEGKSNVIPKTASGLKVDTINALMKPEAGGIEAQPQPSAHGLRAELVVSNANAAARTLTLCWVIENAFQVGPSGLIAGPNRPQASTVVGGTFDPLRIPGGPLAGSTIGIRPQ